MGSMPQWFAKTREMVASDLYFSLGNAGGEAGLISRYQQGLSRLQSPSYYTGSDALDKTTTNTWSPSQTQNTLQSHFLGDWIYQFYPQDPVQYANVGGRFWPLIGSQLVLDQIAAGTMTAIHKALGRTQLQQLGMPPADIDRLFEPEIHNGVDVEGVRPLATSWNCVAPAGDTFFEVDALRGPSVVEFAIATPRPFGHGIMTGVVEQIQEGFRRRRAEGGDAAS
jgi:hypothetical protein